MLNLLFDFNHDGGLFTDRTTPGVPLLNSKHWLRFPTPNPAAAAFDPENPGGPGWEDLGPAGTLLIRSAAQKHLIAIRVAPDPLTAINANATGQIIVAFGRPVVAQQEFASPFIVGTQTIPSFSGALPVRTGGGITGWTFRLDAIARVPGPGLDHVTHRYEFAVGLNVTSGGVTKSYGEDPEFDVGL